MKFYCPFPSKAGIIEEMIEDSFESLEEDDLEEAAQEEVDKILWEVTSGKLFSIAVLIVAIFLNIKNRLLISSFLDLISN